MLKFLRALGLFLALAIAGLALYISLSGPRLPVDTDEIITQVMQTELPEMVKGATGYAHSGNVKIWYEAIEPDGPAKGTILLLMGISNDALSWPPSFLDALSHAGYRVVRYDHRGTGLSDWIEAWDSQNPYSLEDMANDGVAVLEALGIEKAHILGVSMGGMVAQQIVVDHPDRVLSLISIMSSCDIMDPALPPISIEVVQQLIKASIKYGLIASERNTIKLHIASRLILRGSGLYDMNVQAISEEVLYNLRKRAGFNSQASPQHNAAVLASISRYDRLKAVDKPVLIIHGRADPFIPIEHGMNCAHIIPKAETLWVEGMGHDIPDSYVDVIVGKIVMVLQR